MKKSLNILLIEPRNEMVLTGGGATIPLWPCVLSAITPKQHRVDFIHSSFEEVTANKLKRYDLIGVSSRTETANHAYAIGDMCRALKIPCIIGGIHAFVAPEETKQHCDSIVLGEAEYIWGTVLEDARNGKLEKSYKSDYINPDDIPIPDFAVARKYKYKIENVLETVRGCPFNCSFCSATKFSGNKYRYKPVSNILKEIDSWKNKNQLSVIVDLNITSNFDKAKELFHALISKKLCWWGYASANIAKDDEILELMSKSGCFYLGIGFESLSKETLKEMNKSVNIKINYKEFIEKLHYYNIDIFANFIFGMDTDTTDVFEETTEFVLENNIDFPVFQILVPYPGTKVFSDFEKEGRLLTKNWSKYTRTDVVFQPKNMTKQELINGLFGAYEKVYSKRNMRKRFYSKWRGVKKSIYNMIITSHFKKQFLAIKKNYML